MTTTVPSKIKPPLAAGPNLAHSLANHLAGGWLLNEGAGRVAHDLSGHRYDGAFSGGPLWLAGPLGQTVEFDGNDDWIGMGDCLNLGTDDVTVLAIVQYGAANQPDEWAGDHFAAIAGKGYLDATAKGYGLCLYNNRVIWQVRNQSTVFEADSDNVLNDGRWHTVVGVCDRDSSTGVRLYIDGVRQSVTADPTSINGIDLSGSRAFAIGSRQDEANGAWWADFAGRVALVTVWKRVLTEPQIVELQCDPFALFARRRTAACFAIPVGAIIDLAGVVHGTSSASAALQAVRDLSGVCAAATSLVGVLRRAGTRRLQDERSWRREALFNGMTSVAFQLGTALTHGWFWVRRDGSAALYCGESCTQADVSPILNVVDSESVEISLPAHWSPAAGSTCCYLVRRFNSSGSQEQTTTAAVMVCIGPDGKMAQAAPNTVFGLKGEPIGGHKLRLDWFYYPLDQQTAPQEFSICWDGATGQIDLEHPIATIPYLGRRFYQYETVPLDEGRYTFAIRPRIAGHIESLRPAIIVCALTGLSPEAATILSAQAI
jgi:hypothetical protein